MRTGRQHLSVLRDATWIPVALVVAAGATLGVAFDEAPELAAAVESAETVDSDGDGLVDVQEFILLTSPDFADSDADGFGDLEELARGSDPTDDLSLPRRFPLSVGLTGRSVEGTFTAVAPIFVEGGTFLGLDYEFGVVLPGGARFEIAPSYFIPASRIALLPGMELADRVLLIEVRFPSSLVAALGGLHVYSTISDPNDPNGFASAAVLNLIDFDGVIVSVEPAPDDIQQGAGGAIYRPLSLPEQIPAAWSTGQLCWQQTSAVGVMGSSTTFEVGSAQCISSDTFCASSSCNAMVGTAIEMVDPGVLLGG